MLHNMRPHKGSEVGHFAIALIALSVLVTGSLAKKSDSEMLEEIKKYDKCVLQSQFSFVMSEYHPPRTPADFDGMCKRNTEGFKCLREQTKGAEALVRRGLVTLAGSRSRQSKRLCSNPSSEQSKKFLAATKCFMDKSLGKLKEHDQKFIKSMTAILIRNYNDSALELKQLCCTLHDFKQECTNTMNTACPEHRESNLDFMSMLVADVTTIVCEDDEQLNKSCPKLERLPLDKIPNVDSNGSNGKFPSAAAASIYLFATLGEASDTPMKLD